MAPFPWHFGGQRYQNLFLHADEIVEWSCNRLDLRMCFDISHSRLMTNHFGLDFYEFAEKIAPITGHLHLDASGVNGEGLQIGDGDIDFVRLGKILNRLCPKHHSFLKYGRGIKMMEKVLDCFGSPRAVFWYRCYRYTTLIILIYRRN